MVKYIIEINTDVVTREAALFDNSFLIISESCFFPEEFKKDFLYTTNHTKHLSSGKFFYRTSSKFEKGIVLAKLLTNYPNARLLTANVNYFKKLIPGIKAASFQVDDSQVENIIYSNIKQQGPAKAVVPECIERNPEPKFQIPERAYDESAMNPKKVINPPQPEVKRFGPLISNPQYLLPDQGKVLNQVDFKLVPEEISLKNKLDPISRYESKKNEIISLFENKEDQQVLLEIILNSENFLVLRKFSDLFHLVLQSSSDILDMRNPVNIEKIKEIVSTFFEKKLFVIKSEKCEISDLFSKNCWNIDIEFRQN